MTNFLCISVTHLDALFHGKGDNGIPEWPPSPLRLFQAILRGAQTGCHIAEWTDEKAAAFKWLERCEAPLIVCPQVSRATGYTLFVPNNDSDREYDRQHRLTSKAVRPYRLPEELENRTLDYLWRLDHEKDSSAINHAELLCGEVRHLLALGWGIDQAVASGRILTSSQACVLQEDRVSWRPMDVRQQAGNSHRIPSKRTLRDLERVYGSFLNSVSGRQYTPPLRPSVFRRVRYFSPDHIAGLPHAIFELRNDDGGLFAYPQRKLIHIAGMVRHLAKEAMQHYPPIGVPDDWVERYVAGHARKHDKEHRQFSYVPLPSIGHRYTDPSIRRVMIVAPVGDGDWLEYLAGRISGSQLKPEGNEFGEQGPPTLNRVHRDKVARQYTASANRWASVTPVILPGHTDRKSGKTIKLIERSLREAGIEQPCTFEWSPVSRFATSLAAHKTDREGKPIYFKPTYLQSLSALHLTLTFDDDFKVPGPLAIGAGRHCGFGLLAHCLA